MFIGVCPQTIRAARSLGCNAASVIQPNKNSHRRVGTVVTINSKQGGIPMSDVPAPHTNSIPCCPDLNTDQICDVLDQRNRLAFPTHVRTRAGQPIQVEVVIHTRFTRCSGPLAQGDLVYSTTLLP